AIVPPPAYLPPASGMLPLRPVRLWSIVALGLLDPDRNNHLDVVRHVVLGAGDLDDFLAINDVAYPVGTGRIIAPGDRASENPHAFVCHSLPPPPFVLHLSPLRPSQVLHREPSQPAPSGKPCVLDRPTSRISARVSGIIPSRPVRLW